jgi:hypothetical protein
MSAIVISVAQGKIRHVFIQADAARLQRVGRSDGPPRGGDVSRHRAPDIAP